MLPKGVSQEALMGQPRGKRPNPRNDKPPLKWQKARLTQCRQAGRPRPAQLMGFMVPATATATGTSGFFKG